MEKSTYKNINIIYIMLLFPFLDLTILRHYIPYYNIGIKIAKIVVYLVIFFLVVKKRKISIDTILIASFCVILAISSKINKIETMKIITSIAYILMFYLLFDYGLKHDIYNFLYTLKVFLLLLICLNFVSIALCPNGIYTNSDGYTQNWILGYKNTHILYQMMYILCSIVLNYILDKNIKKTDIVVYLIILVSNILIGNKTAIISLTLMSICIILYKRFPKILNKINFTLSYIIIYFGLIIFRVQEKLGSIINKNITFTGRRDIWNTVEYFIKKKPIFGYGNTLFEFSDNIVTTHNFILDIIYRTGIVGLICFGIYIIYSLKNLINYKQYKISSYIEIITFCFYIMCLMESYSFGLAIIPFIFCNNIKSIINAKKELLKNEEEIK